MAGVLCGYHLALIRPRANQADGAFLSNLFSLKKTQRYFFTHANGATRFGLSVDTIRDAAFCIPRLEEHDSVKVGRLASWLVRMGMSDPDRLSGWAEQLEPDQPVPDAIKLARVTLVSDLRAEWRTVLRERLG